MPSVLRNNIRLAFEHVTFGFQYWLHLKWVNCSFVPSSVVFCSSAGLRPTHIATHTMLTHIWTLHMYTQHTQAISHLLNSLGCIKIREVAKITFFSYCSFFYTLLGSTMRRSGSWKWFTLSDIWGNRLFCLPFEYLVKCNLIIYMKQKCFDLCSDSKVILSHFHLSHSCLFQFLKVYF